MPFSRDSLDALRTRIAADIERRTGGDATNPGTGYTEIGLVFAGLVHGIQGNQQWLAQQINAVNCDDEELLKRAANRDIFQIAPSFAQGQATVNGTDGKTINAEEVLQHTDGRQYRVAEDATIAAGAAALNVIALEPGISGNLNGDQLSFITPLDGIDSRVTVDEPGIAAGADEEKVSRVRERFLEHLQQPPMGGKDYDYVQWARQASVDVTRAWPFFHEDGIGSVVVRFVTENLSDPIPTQGHIDQVTAYMDTVKPGGLRAFAVEVPTAKPLNLIFTSLTPNTSTVQAAINAQVQDLLRREGKPQTVIPLSHIRAAISRATDEEDFAITLNQDVVIAANEFPTLGNTTWPGQ